MKAISNALRLGVVLAVAAFVAGCGDRTLAPRNPSFTDRNGQIFFLIGDTVWNDLNHNGRQDSGEPGIGGVAVKVSGTNFYGQTVPDTTKLTDANGYYEFAMLDPGTYTVTVTTPAGYLPTLQLQGDTIRDSNGPAKTVTLLLDPPARQDNLTVDFGFVQVGSIGDRVWNDVDGDGVQDGGEAGLNGWTVTITGTNLPTGYANTTTTVGDGLYQFAGLPAGTYTVCVTPAATYTQTYDLDGVATANCAARTIVAGETATDVDFGYRQVGSIGDRVWEDLNGNGQQDDGATGLTPWTVTIAGANLPAGYVTTTTTAGDGLYHFNNLPAGTYTVCVTPVAGYAQTYDLDGLATPDCAARTIVAGENVTDVDFGYRQVGSIGDRVWYDANGDGVQDGSESGLSGWTVTIGGASLPSGYVTTQTTGTNGIYTFTNLPAGTYTVCVTPMAGYTQTYDLDGLATPHCAARTIAAGASATDVDFGYRQLGSLGDRVWEDLNGNGQQDDGATGLTPWTVTISGANLPSGYVTTTTTAADGIYHFTNLPAGTYHVCVVPAAGYSETYDLTAPMTDNCADRTIVAGETATDVDFGYRQLGSIGDRVWNDANGNGTQDVGETGLNGWMVRISGPNLPAGYVATTPTAGDGNYHFYNLPAGTYTVCVTAPVAVGWTETFDLTAPTTDNCATRTIVAGENATDVDFGYQRTASIGDRVWNDLNGNGVQDAGEPGLSGWTVTITGSLPAGYVPTRTTDANGLYTFGGLPAGTYTVCTTLQTGWTQTYDLTAPTTDNCATRTVAAAENATDVDFGYWQPASLGDRVWEDLNGDGLQNDGATGLTGWTVTITGTSLPTGYVNTATTAGDGLYHFSNLPAGTYQVCVTPAGGYTQTYDLDGLATPHCATRTLAAGENATNVDFGYWRLGSIGDRVWNDLNGNGQQDVGEPGLNGWMVRISGPNLPVGYVATTPTAGDGNYHFYNLPAGTYTVCVTAPVAVGWTETADLDFPLTPNCAPRTIVAGENATDVDFGYQRVASIGDRVWNDLNGNGVQDAGEPGLSGWTVTITGSLPAGYVPTRTTDANGLYTFGGLPAGTYTVCTTLQTGWTQTYDLTAPTTDNCATRTVAAAENATDVDFGYWQPASLGDRVWEDLNGNSAQDDGATGLNGWTVTITGTSLPTGYVNTATTAGDGLYTFSNLPAGTYQVCVTPAGGYTQTYDLDGLATPHCATRTLAAGENATNVDFGYWRLGSIGDRVWNDANGNGTQDAGEAGLTPWTVTISGATLPTGYVTTQTTGVNGIYTFTGLPAGTYTVCVAPMAGYTQTYDLDGLATPNCAPRTIVAGENVTDVDFGYRQLGSIGDRVWYDANGNGTQEGTEAGLSGWTVTISGANLPSGYTTTQVTNGGNGIYTFTGLPAGTYQVCVTPMGGYTQTYDLDGLATPNCAPRTIVAGENATDVDFGYRQLGSIGDRVWYDANGNGTQESTEAGLSGWTVTISGANLPSGYTTTQVTNGGNGIYTFTGLPAGTYQVCVTPMGGYTQTYDLDGLATANCATRILGAGENATDVDFGYRQLGSIGDRVWYDANGNGTQESTEAGLSGWTVTISGANLPSGYTTTQVTNGGNGIYTFTGLPAGTYQVCVTPMGGYTQTYDLDGLATANCATRILGAGENATNVDFGYRQLGSIGDRVWNDANGNGVQDAGEAGLTPWTVTISGANLPTGYVTTQTTGANGIYTFTNLPAGTYTVCVTPLSGYTQTYDLDGVATPNCAVRTIAAGVNATDVDFGYQLPPTNACVDGLIDGVVNLSPLRSMTNDLFFFADGSVDANWQGATKGFAGNVYINGIRAAERTSGGVPFAGTIFTNDVTLGAWQSIVTQNAGQAFASYSNTGLITSMTSNLVSAIVTINALPVTTGYASVSATSLNGLNTTDGVGRTYVINVTSGLQVSSQINITGDANDVFILRWDTDANPANGYQGQVKFQSGGAIVPKGGLTAANFIHVAGDMNASGGGSNPPAPYPQGPRGNNGTGALVSGASNFSGGGFFTGYWLTTGAPTTAVNYGGSTLYIGNTSPFSNAVFVGGWYSLTNKFSMTSGTSGVNVVCR